MLRSLFLTLTLTLSLQAQVPPDKALATLKVGDGLPGRAVRRRADVRQPDLHGHRPQGPRLGLRVGQLPPQDCNRPILRPGGRPHRHPRRHRGRRQGRQGHRLLPGPGAATARSASRVRQGPGSARATRSSSASRRTSSSSRTRTATARPMARRRSSSPASAASTTTTAFTASSSARTASSTSPSATRASRTCNRTDGKGRKWTSNNTDCQAGTIWRCDLDGKNLELIAHNFRNEYEPCVDSFGDIWLSRQRRRRQPADAHLLRHARRQLRLPPARPRPEPLARGAARRRAEDPAHRLRHADRHLRSTKARCCRRSTGASCCTPTPARARSAAITCKPKGAGYDVEREDMLSRAPTTGSGRSDVCVAPDGSVFVADWYDPGVGGHGMGDTTRGRIYRITPKGHKGYKVSDSNLSQEMECDRTCDRRA